MIFFSRIGKSYKVKDVEIRFFKKSALLDKYTFCYGLGNKGQEILALFLPKRRPKMFSGTFIFHLTNKLGHDVIGLSGLV